MMSGVPLETCWAFKKPWNNKFYYKVASCWYFYWVSIVGYIQLLHVFFWATVITVTLFHLFPYKNSDILRKDKVEGLQLF